MPGRQQAPAVLTPAVGAAFPSGIGEGPPAARAAESYEAVGVLADRSIAPLSAWAYCSLLS